MQMRKGAKRRIGPMAFAPLSEILGRRIIYGTTLLIAVVFIIPGAVAKNVGTILVARAIDGIAFSAPMTLVGGTLADLWRSEERGVPMAAFSAAPFIGPASMYSPQSMAYLSISTITNPLLQLDHSSVVSCLTVLAGVGCTGFN